MTESLVDFATAKLEALEARQLRRVLVETDRSVEARAERSGRPLISFSCNDYLGLSVDPRVIEAALTATRAQGTGAGASRLVTGNHAGYGRLEAQLAALKGTEDAVVFGSGYLANLAITPALVGAGDLIVMDELCHACLFSGARLSGAKVLVFPHNDVGAAKALLREHRASARHCLMLTDGVFSMDGDLAPLPCLAALAERFDAWLMADDAHGIGVVGGGRGASFAFSPKAPLALQMGTLSKAVGAYGGYVACAKPVADLLRTRARPFIYTTGLPPGTVAAASKALEIILEEPERVARPVALARRFAEALGLPVPQSAVVPLVVGTPEAALTASKALEERGFLVIAIRPPTVPEGTSRLRFAFSAAHTDAQVAGLIEAVRALPQRQQATQAAQ